MIREMQLSDYDCVINLFSITPGVTLREADSYESTQSYLERNPHLNFVKVKDGKIIGCVMCGHDGRRGYLQHLLVLEAYRNQGFGDQLFNACIDSLAKLGIQKTHIFVFKTNTLANDFWERKGWTLRSDLNMYSLNRSDNANA